MRFENGLRCVFFIVGSLVASSARAQPDKPDDNRPVVGPPPEMVEACKSSAAGDACAVTLNAHTIDGICRAGPKPDTPLACVPNGPPPGIGAAADACKDRAAGDSCTVAFSDRTIEGTCRADPHRDGSLICLPAKPHRM